MSAPIPLEAAWERLFALAPPLGAETLPVDDCAGRYLAASLAARRTQPGRDLSAMDGFAVRGAGPWRIVGEARAGADFAGTLTDGEAARISTGAACPEGTEGIVIVEDAEVAGEILTARAAPEAGYIRRKGFDFRDGDTLLESGVRIGPAQFALARAGGHSHLTVARRPRLAIIECGDELAADPAQCGPDRLPASNGAMVAAMASGLASTERLGPLPDDRGTLVAALRECSDADLIVTTAGASVGDHDHVKAALEDWGARLDFWKVAIRPGKPLLVARRGPQLVIGLPGNPVSSFVTAFLFVLPVLRALQGASAARPVTIPVSLAAGLPPGGTRREFRRACLVDGNAVPLSERDSSALSTLAAADLLIDRPVDAPGAEAGDMVSTYWIGNGGMA